MQLKEELQSIVKGEVLDDEETLKRYSRDTSLFEIRPRVVVFPKSKEDIKSLVRFVNEHPEENLSLTCRAAGTDMSGGALSESIVLDMTKYFNHIGEVTESYAWVEPGVFYRDFEVETLKHGALVPSYPASREICTVGGMVANNSGGEKSVIHGKTEDYIEELEVILSDGNEYTIRALSHDEYDKKAMQGGFEGDIYRQMYQVVDNNYDLLKRAKPNVSKNSAGYFLWNVWDKKNFDLNKLLTGSQGTLCIITNIKFRLIKEHYSHASLLVIFLKDFKTLVKIINKILKHKPESSESFDDHTLKFALRYVFGFIKLLKSNVFSLAWQFLPEFKMFLFGGLPKLIILAEFTGSSREEANEKAEEAKKDLEGGSLQMRVIDDPKEIKKYFTIRRESFNLLRHHLTGKRTAPFIDDIIVRPDKLPEFLPKLEKVLAEYKSFIYTMAGHMGEGNFHIIPLMDLSKEENRKIIPELSKKVYKLVLEYEGSITAEHNDGIIRTPFLIDMYGKEVIDLFAETKKIFDPNNIFNPGKKVNGDMKYAMDHMAKHN